MSQNPYQPIETRDDVGPLPGGTVRGLVDSDEKHLWVTSPAVLPERCVLTDQTDRLLCVSKPMYYVPPVAYFGLLLGLPGFLILYLIFRKRVNLTYYVNRDIRNRRGWLTALAVFVMFSGVVLMATSSTSGLFLLFVGLALILAGFVGLAKFASTLTVAAHKADEFKLKGCCPGFLEHAMDGLDDPYHDPALEG